MPNDKDRFCDPVFIGTNTGGNVWWCAECGAVLDSYGEEYENPRAVDRDTLYCPKQGLIP